jgi:hypothetical protein
MKKCKLLQAEGPHPCRRRGGAGAEPLQGQTVSGF